MKKIVLFCLAIFILIYSHTLQAETIKPSGLGKNSNYLTLNGQEWVIKSIYLIPWMPGENPALGDQPLNADYQAILSNIKNTGANAVTVLHALMPPEFYRQARAKGLKIIQGVWFTQDPADFQDAVFKASVKNDIKNMIDNFHNRDGVDYSEDILMLNIGNEFNENSVQATNNAHQQINIYTGTYISAPAGSNATECFLAEICDYAATYEVNTYGVRHYITHHTWPVVSPSMLNTAFLDVICYNVYSYWPASVANHSGGSVTGTPYQGYLEEIKARYSSKPFYIGEFGYSTAPTKPDSACVTEQEQAQGLKDRWQDITTASPKIAGGSVYNYMDEWWPQAETAVWPSIADEDEHAADDREEWFGIVKVNGSSPTNYTVSMKPAYNSLIEMYGGSSALGPTVLYTDTAWNKPFNGLMGSNNGSSLTVNQAYPYEPAQGTSCTYITYDRTKESWAGIFCLNNGWNGPGLNLTGQKRLIFKAKSWPAGVKVKFGIGASSSQDTTIKEISAVPLVIGSDWMTYSVELNSCDLSNINGLWYFTITAEDNAALPANMSLYIDDVRYTTENIDITPPIGVPATPTDPGVYISSTTINFNWNPGTCSDPESGIAWYYLQVSTSTDFTTCIFAGDCGDKIGTSMYRYKTISGCQQGAVYYARVKAKNGGGLYSGYSAVSNGIKIDLTAPTGLPSVPIDAGATSASTTITFNWNTGSALDAESGIAGYYLQISTSTSFSTCIYNLDVGNVFTKTISDCVNGNTYYARVRARNGAGLYGNYTTASDGILISAGTNPTYTIGTTPYSWITTSTATGINKDDESKIFMLPFTFKFYGINYNQIYVCSNGFLSFVSNSRVHVPVTIPNTAPPNALLAAYWRDLNPKKSGSSITYSSSATRFVVTWSVYNYANSNKQTFQVILYNTGEIIYQYQSITKDLTTVIGVENQAGTAGKSYASASINNGIALKFTPATTMSAALDYAPSPDFVEGEAYVYPNPVKEGKDPVIHVEVGEADKVEVYIYDVAGDLQDSVEITDAPNIIDGKYAYEYQWDTTDQASGVYIARIVATKGSDKLKITKKLAVVK
ncbi:MAG: T9SS type A sorting domain-containing protein [bacterium]|nr:T9SS type A sorting domain-containing protein [bacterium]